MKILDTSITRQVTGKSQWLTRLFFFWGMLYAPPISFESVQINSHAAQTIRECMRAYGELRALTVGVYSNDESLAYGSRVALMCCSLARYVAVLKTEAKSTCSPDDIEYVARLVALVQKDCLVWYPNDDRLVLIKSFVIRMLVGTGLMLEEIALSMTAE